MFPERIQMVSENFAMDPDILSASNQVLIEVVPGFGRASQLLIDWSDVATVD